MYLTTDLFLWVSGIEIAILLALIGFLWNISLKISPLSSLANHIQAKVVDEWFVSRGLMGTNPKSKHHSLPPDKAARRDYLVSIGKIQGLNEQESQELRSLLEEDARTDFTHGLINLVALGLILLAIGAIVKSMSK